VPTRPANCGEKGGENRLNQPEGKEDLSTILAAESSASSVLKNGHFQSRAGAMAETKTAAPGTDAAV
jgi:hypothetical protein